MEKNSHEKSNPGLSLRRRRPNRHTLMKRNESDAHPFSVNVSAEEQGRSIINCEESFLFCFSGAMMKTVICFVVFATATFGVRVPQVHETVDETPWKVATNGNFFSLLLDSQKMRYLQQLQRRRRPNKREINYGLDHGINLQLLDEQQEALNALLGQAPMAQLNGLQRLLVPKDHTPIMENVVDVANTQQRPNIKVVHAPPELQPAVAQGHLFRDSLAQINTGARARALERAQKAARQEVRAQEETLALLQARAEEEALRQARHYKAVPFRPPPPREEVVTKPHRPYAAEYAFGYQIRDAKSGNDFGHEEVHDGRSAKGRYHVLLPDGRLQNVNYWADETGFHAKVTYDRVAHH